MSEATNQTIESYVNLYTKFFQELTQEYGFSFSISEALNGIQHISDPLDVEDVLYTMQGALCYEYIYKTLGLDSWMQDHNENVPYESFSLCGVKDEMDLFQYITLLKALINDRREGIVTQTGKKEKEQ